MVRNGASFTNLGYPVELSGNPAWRRFHVISRAAGPGMTVQDAEGQGRYCEEIHGGDSFAVVAEKNKPSFREIGVPGSTFHPSRYAALGDIEAKHEQLAVNAGCAPGRVLGHHQQEQVAHLLAHRFAAGSARSPRAPSPIPTKAG